MSYDDDQIVMAAEYVLGTLDGDERAQVETMLSVDKDFRSLVESWELRLGELNAMVGSIEPPEDVWAKIRATVTAIAPDTAIRLPELSTPPIAAAVAPPPPAAQTPPDTGQVVEIASRLRRSRNIAQVMTALAACMVGLIAVQLTRPDALPGWLRPKPRVETVQAPAPAQYVAVLQQDGGSPAFIMTVDVPTKAFTIRRAAADPVPGKSFELWMVSDKFTQPRSLGVVGDTDFTSKPVLAAFDAATINGATYAITVEPPGGSPSGSPTSAPIFAGKLIETVPASSIPPPATPAR